MDRRTSWRRTPALSRYRAQGREWELRYNSVVPKPLDCASRPTYCRRRSAGRQGAVMLGSAVVAAGGLLAAFEIVSGDSWERWRVYPLVIIVFGMAGAVAFTRMIRGGHWESRIEGGQLYLSSPDRPTQVIPVQEITHLVTLDVTTDAGLETQTTRSHHLRLRDGRTVSLPAETWGWLGSFRRALQREDPRIQLAHEHQDRRRKEGAPSRTPPLV